MKWLLLLVSFLVTVLLYWPILNLSFTQDDWFLLHQAKFNSPREQFLASLPNPDSIYFRPLGMQGHFYLTYRFFGLHEWMYRLVTIAIHSLNVVLIFSLSSLLFSSVFFSISISTLYFLSPLHFASLGWLANVSFVTGTFMTFLILKTALDGRNKLSITLFFLGLLVNELVITTPMLLLMLKIMKACHLSVIPGPSVMSSGSNDSTRNLYRSLIRSGMTSRFLTRFAGALARRVKSGMTWMFIIGIGYIIFRELSPRAAIGSYELILDPRLVAQNIRWLFLWSLGWPEASKDYFLSLLKLSHEWIKTFPIVTLFTILANFIIFIAAALRIIQNPRSMFGILYGLAWFLISTAPVLFFRSHVFPHYAVIGSLGLYVLITSGLRHLHRSFKFLFLALWLIQSILAFRVNIITHWWVRHARLSQELIDQTRRQYSTIPSDKTIVLSVRDPKQAEIVLAGDSAMQVLYNDPAVKTVFVKDESGHPGAETR